MSCLPLGLDLGDKSRMDAALGLDDLAGPPSAARAQVCPLEHRLAVAYRDSSARFLAAMARANNDPQPYPCADRE